MFIFVNKKMIDRIKNIIAQEGLSSSQFADEISLQRSSLSHVLSGRNKPSLDFIIKIKTRFPKIDLEWLLFGNGSMLVTENVIKGVKETNIVVEEKDNNEQQKLNFDSGSVAVKSDNNVKNDIKVINDESNSENGKAKKVIIFYSNGTFEEFTKG